MDGITDSLWDAVLGYVRSRSADLARGWFTQLEPLRLQHGVLDIQTANDAQHRYLEQNCVPAFMEAAQAVTGRLVSVRFVGPPGGNGSPEPPPLSFHQIPDQPAFNPDYNFENFVVGPCNRLAHAACVAVSETPGTTYNPLFIHGDVGLGKTHLLHAVCQKVHEKREQARVLYLSCETFNNHFIEAIERGALHEFRYRYRHVDVLVIDDIQFLAARDQSQEEFFHTFNTLYQGGKQLILTADTPPKELNGIEERLTSRFNWGLVARVDRPCLDTRTAIVKKKARLRCVELPDDVVLYIAANIDSNTRELEGAIIKVDAVAQQHDGRIDLDVARMALHDETTVPRPEVTIPVIQDAVVRHFGVRLSDIQSKKRSRSIAFARQVCMYLARELTRMSLEEIGRWLGGRDHSTVLHASRQISEQRKRDPELDRTIARLIEDLRHV
jgi:chromosomal replication initiator protein